MVYMLHPNHCSGGLLLLVGKSTLLRWVITFSLLPQGLHAF
jgi:hypothetical protein